jgi:hypothetical protein
VCVCNRIEEVYHMRDEEGEEWEEDDWEEEDWEDEE